MDVVEIEVLPTTSAHPTCDEARTNRTSCVIFVPLSGLWVEPEDARFLITTTGLSDPRRPRVDAGGLCRANHGVRIAVHPLPLVVGHDHRGAGEGNQVFGHGTPSLMVDGDRE